jgi:hypothetical protein
LQVIFLELMYFKQKRLPESATVASLAEAGTALYDVKGSVFDEIIREYEVCLFACFALVCGL